MGITLEFGEIQGLTMYLRAQTIFFARTCFKIRGYVSTLHSARFLVSETSQTKSEGQRVHRPPPLPHSLSQITILIILI